MTPTLVVQLSIVCADSVTGRASKIVQHTHRLHMLQYVMQVGHVTTGYLGNNPLYVLYQTDWLWKGSMYSIWTDDDGVNNEQTCSFRV